MAATVEELTRRIDHLEKIVALLAEIRQAHYDSEIAELSDLLAQAVAEMEHSRESS